MQKGSEKTHLLLLSKALCQSETTKGGEWQQWVWTWKWRQWVSNLIYLVISSALSLSFWVFKLLTSPYFYSSHWLWRWKDWPVQQIYQFPRQLTLKLFHHYSAPPLRFSTSKEFQSELHVSVWMGLEANKSTVQVENVPETQSSESEAVDSHSTVSLWILMISDEWQ